jgi:WD40 repeat protein
VVIDHPAPVVSVFFMPGAGQLCATVSSDGLLKLSSAKTGKTEHEYHLPRGLESLEPVPGLPYCVGLFADGAFRLFNAGSEFREEVVQKTVEPVVEFLPEPNKKALVWRSKSGRLYRLDLETGRQTLLYPGHTATALSYDAEGTHILAAATNGDILLARDAGGQVPLFPNPGRQAERFLCDTTNGLVIWFQQGSRGRIEYAGGGAFLGSAREKVSVAKWSPDGGMIATGLGNGDIRLYIMGPQTLFTAFRPRFVKPLTEEQKASIKL